MIFQKALIRPGKKICIFMSWEGWAKSLISRFHFRAIIRPWKVKVMSSCGFWCLLSLKYLWWWPLIRLMVTYFDLLRFSWVSCCSQKQSGVDELTVSIHSFPTRILSRLISHVRKHKKLFYRKYTKKRPRVRKWEFPAKRRYVSNKSRKLFHEFNQR